MSPELPQWLAWWGRSSYCSGRFSGKARSKREQKPGREVGYLTTPKVA